MVRNLHITIHEAAPRRLRRAAPGTAGQAGWDPSEPLVTTPDPSDPTEPLVTTPDPSDPSGGWYAAAGPWGATGPAWGYGPVATVVESRGAAPPACCCCCPSEKAQAPQRPGATVRDRSGFVIVRLAAGIDLGAAGSLWQLADRIPLPALKAALELRLDEAGGEEGGDRGEGEAAGGGVQSASFGHGKRRKKGDGDEDTPPERPPEPLEPAGALVSRPLIDLDRRREEKLLGRAAQLTAIRELERRAALTSFKPLHSLTGYWRVDVRRYPDRIDEVVERINRLSEVDLAYAELVANDPQQSGAVPCGMAFDEDQGYLDDAPVGIGARWAWHALGSLGSPPGTVRVCDLEQRWNSGHREFGAEVLNKQQIVGGGNRFDGQTDFGHHGTAVLGQLAATGAAGGVAGTATGIGEFVLASHYWPESKQDGDGRPHPFRDTDGHVASAIVNLLVPAASYPLLDGDVLLLEVQRGRLPTEIDAADFDAVRLASALGVIVVEAGGNGGFDLDRYVDPDTGASLNRADSRFRDSGAIAVGAARSAAPHDRASFSNYGSRIDCCAWGESVTSCGYGDLSDPLAAADAYYTNTFSGTSSAAPIIAGAAALVQALHHAVSGNRLLPRAMRAALSDPRAGTRQGPNVAGAIGVMPDLRALVRDRLQLVPDFYMRRAVDDDGTRPVPGGTLSSSPDILVWHGEGNASQLFGEGVRANTPAPGDPFDWTVPDALYPREVYVRLRNRGFAGGAVPVRLYASRAATLITPERWQPIGTLLSPGIPQGDTLVVAGPLGNWSLIETNRPPTSAFWSGQVVPPVSFLAVHGADAALPPAPPYFDWAEYRAFLRGPGVAWRNAHKVRIATPPAQRVELGFFLAGTPDRGRTFGFEVLQRLPAGLRVTLKVHPALAAKMRQRQHWLANGGGDLALPARPRMSLGQVYLPAGLGADAAFHLEATGTNPVQPGLGHSLAIRQLWRGEEVGRITWWFVPPPG